MVSICLRSLETSWCRRMVRKCLLKTVRGRMLNAWKKSPPPNSYLTYGCWSPWRFSSYFLLTLFFSFFTSPGAPYRIFLLYLPKLPCHFYLVCHQTTGVGENSVSWHHGRGGKQGCSKGKLIVRGGGRRGGLHRDKIQTGVFYYWQHPPPFQPYSFSLSIWWQLLKCFDSYVYFLEFIFKGCFSSSKQYWKIIAFFFIRRIIWMLRYFQVFFTK